MVLRRVVPISCVLLVFAVQRDLRAQPEPPAFVDPGAPAVVERARRDRDLGRFDEAIDGFARAYQMSGDSTLLFDMAETHRAAAHDADALRLFQTYLRRDPRGARRESAEKQIRELERQASQTTRKGGGDVKAPVAAVKPPPTTVVPGAAPAPAPIRPVAAPPVVRPPPPPSPPVVTTPPPLAVTPPPPAAPTAPPPARFDVGTPAQPDGAPPLLTATGTTDVAPPAGGQPPLPRWVPWTLAAATVALGTGAIVSGLSASNRYDELHGSCGRTLAGCTTSEIDDVRSRALRTNLLWALTAAAAIGTGVTLYVNVHEAGLGGVWRF